VRLPPGTVYINAKYCFVQSGEEFSMQGKEPERGDPSGYAFGVKCSATLSGE
jgi:hypothetical protein